jgi:NAD(P)H-flavin reductase
MEFAKPQKFTARVSEKYYLSDSENFLFISFELVLPDRIEFLAGQYVSLKINEQGERRSYSIASSPDDNHGFHLVAEMVPEGSGSQYLKEIKLGEVVEVLAPLGRFAVSDGPEKLLFVATGSGIVPIYSMINDLLINQHESRQMRLHWGMRSEADIFWFDNFERLTQNYPNFVFDPVLSRPGEEWSLCSGHVQDCLKRDFPSTSSGLEGWEGYVCGNPTMVEDLVKLLGEMGIAADNIYHEKFV